VTLKPTQCNQSSWTGVKNNVVCDDCTALVSTSDYACCDDFCRSQDRAFELDGLSCVGAFEDWKDTCQHSRTLRCDDDLREITADMLCQCHKTEILPCKWTDNGEGKNVTGDAMNFPNGKSFKITDSIIGCKEFCENIKLCNGVQYNSEAGGQCYLFSGVTRLRSTTSDTRSKTSSAFCAPADYVEITDDPTTAVPTTAVPITSSPTTGAPHISTAVPTSAPTTQAPVTTKPSAGTCSAASGSRNPNTQFYVSYKHGCPSESQMMQSEEECEAAASDLNLKDVDGHSGSYSSRPRGCYLKAGHKCQLVFNRKGVRRPTDPDRPVLCRVSPYKELSLNIQWETIVSEPATKPGSVGSSIQVGIAPNAESVGGIDHIDVSWNKDTTQYPQGRILIYLVNPYGQILMHYHLTYQEIVGEAEEGLMISRDGTMSGFYEAKLEEIELKFIFKGFNFNKKDAPHLMFTIRPRHFWPMIETDNFDLPEHPSLKSPNSSPKHEIPLWALFGVLGLFIFVWSLGYCLKKRTQEGLSNNAYYSIVLEEQLNQTFSSRDGHDL